MTPPRCPTPKKRAYHSRGEADRHLEEIRHHQPAEADGKETYLCHCRSWHVGDPRKHRPDTGTRTKRWVTVTGGIRTDDEGVRTVIVAGRTGAGTKVSYRFLLEAGACEGEFLSGMRKVVEQLEDAGIR